MRKRLVLLSFVAAVSLVSAAPAQPGKKAAAPKEEGKPEAGKAAKAEPEKADRPVAAGEAAPAGSDDLGAPPPKDVVEQKAEQSLKAAGSERL